MLPKAGKREALALIGPRRAGKSTLALRLLDAWKRKGGETAYFDSESVKAPRTAAELLKKLSGTPKKTLGRIG